jgi:integration host factor subunit alpha
VEKVITKAKLVTVLKRKEPQLGTALAMQLTNAFFEEIIFSLTQGEEVKFSGLGSFRIRQKKARPGRNPKTGVNSMISPRNVVLFQASQKLKKKLKNKS